MMESEHQTKAETPKSRPARMTAEKALPQSSADTLVKIIKGYAIASTGGQSQVNYKDVASVAGISPTIVSGNNRFLLESQILFSPKFGFYIPSEEAVRFARESAWDEPAAKAHLRSIVASTWYGQIAIQNFTLRPMLRREDLKRALAIKSGATEGDSTALDFLTDFLTYTGLIIEKDDGSLVRGETNAELAPSEATSPVPPGNEARIRTGPVPAHQSISLTVHIHIRNAEDLTPEYASRVKEWLGLLEIDGDHAEVSISAVDHESLALAG
jgi:hypothetical protein